MQKIGRIIAILFIVGGLILIIGKKIWFPEFYNPIFMGLMGFVSAFLVVSSRLFLKPKNQQQEKVLDMIQTGMVFGLVFSALGALGLFQLYKVGIQYDKILHFLNSFILTTIVIRSYEGWQGFGFEKSLSFSVMIVFSGGVVWEMYEFLGDTLIGTQMLGYYGQLATKDTIWDMIMNWSGIILAVTGVKILKKK